MSNVFQLMNQQFPNMFKSPPGENPALRGVSTISPAGQKVVCTPEVSLYQYGTPEMAAVAGGGSLQRIMEEKGLVMEPNVGLHGPNGVVGANAINGNGGFQCGFCGKTFQQKNTFQNHLRSHREGEDQYCCDVCGKTFAVPARLTRHYRTHTGEKPYQCEYCNKSFSVKENLSVHRRIHTKERPYKCEVCERAFEHSGKLHRHMRIHTGERPHRCQICQKTFIQSGQLVIHMRTHTGEKPYVCKVCGKGFTCSKQLKVHTRTHTGEKPYTCDICGKSFGYNHVLKLHQVAHYGEKVYKCTLCNGTFNSKKALETHIKTHSEDHVPPGPGSPVTEPGVLSPISSISQATPQSQNSDKENRESSDSELSSQNSPSSSNDGPKTPPSPPMNAFPQGQHQFARMDPTNSNNSSSNNGNDSQDKTCSTLPIPYPMLPPGVRIQQAPHSQTTFLYVTSKLPPHPPALSSSPPHSPPLSTGRLQQNSFAGLNTLSNGVSKQFEQKVDNGSGRNKLLMHKIREKVLQFTEKFGYGVNPAELQQQQQSTQKRFVENGGTVKYTSPTGGVSVHPIMVPENLSFSNFNSNDTQSYHQNRLRHHQQQFKREGSSSPEIVQEQSSTSHQTYTPGGVLALALTKGSKAVAAAAAANNLQHIPAKVSLIPVTTSNNNGLFNGYHSSQLQQMSRLSPRSCSPPSPLDFHQQQLQQHQQQFYMRGGSRPDSVSPRNSLHSSPNSTPRSTPSLQEDYSDEKHLGREELSGDESTNSSSSMAGSKRSRSPNSNSGGPRKRSSLILEKYAMENPASPCPPQTPPSNESILSQRLRLSSVIQYAEKCS